MDVAVDEVAAMEFYGNCVVDIYFTSYLSYLQLILQPCENGFDFIILYSFTR